MIAIENIPVILCRDGNYSAKQRTLSDIEFIVMHYTGNRGDTARNNCLYYQRTLIKSSAHYYCDKDGILCSVPWNYTAWAVGLGNMTKPYIPNPAYYRRCTNSNSISIEMCGGKGSLEADAETKENACRLAAALLLKFHLPVDRLIRHYDVTGKKCPAWAVDSAEKWEWLRQRTAFYMKHPEGEEEMTKEEFFRLCDEWEAKKAELPADWEAEDMKWAQERGLIKDGKAKANVRRGELARVLKRLAGSET